MASVILHSYFLFSPLLCVLGVDTVIVKSGRRICGTGGALANAPLVQSKSYFEMKVQSGGWQPFCSCFVCCLFQLRKSLVFSLQAYGA